MIIKWTVIGLSIIFMALAALLLVRPGVFGFGEQKPVTAGLPSGGDTAWEERVISIEGRDYRVRIREHTPAIALREVLQTVSRTEATAMGLWALSMDHALQITGRDGFAALSQYFEDPEKSVRFYEETQAQSGGWEELADRVRAATESEMATIQIVGEAVYDDYHIYVLRRPETAVTFRVLRRLPDGRYRHVNEWGPDIGPLLRENRLVALFGSE